MLSRLFDETNEAIDVGMAFGIAGHCINKSPMYAIRDDNWKLLFNPDGSRTELYDIPNDVMELNNMAEKHPDVVQRLSKKVKEWAATLPEGAR